ncbi:MAG: roadblock/LC7 domain-containing protein [Halothece sp.]
MGINVEKLNQIIQDFASTTSDVQGVALVTPDGLPLATTLPAKMDEERVAAMSASMLSLGERIGKELARGNVERILVEGGEGYGILTSCTEEALFLVLASRQAKQGVLMLDIKRILEELRLVL